MATETLAEALEREHREIDGGIERYVAALAQDDADPAPMRRTMEALRRHIYLEERFLFPPLNGPGLMMAIQVMLREHGELWDLMAGLDGLIASAADPGEITGRCQDLLGLLDGHNTKEEAIIYSQADAILSAEATDELRAFLVDGRMPDGWRCAKATA